jgi:hypothetical protein
MTDWTNSPIRTHSPTRTHNAGRGRARAIGVTAVMGLVWAGSALSGLDSAVARPVLVASVAIFVALTAGARRQRGNSPDLPQASVRTSAAAGAGTDNGGRRFLQVAVVEVAAILGSAVILAASGHSVWIPAAICAVVGLHFIPLARLFGIRLYHLTALALCLVAATTLIAGATGAPDSLVRFLPCAGAALSLWATGAWLLLARPPDRPTG